MRLWSPLLFLLIAGSRALNEEDLYPYGDDLDERMPPGDETSSPEIFVDVPIALYGTTYRSLYVNTNGFISFRTDIPNFLNVEFPIDYPSISPFYTNVDTTTSGAIFYRATQDPYILEKAAEDVIRLFPQYTNFTPSMAFIATWVEVGYHSRGSDKTNTYQVVIITDGIESFVIFLYPENKIQWIQGMTQVTGLPDARAQAGFVGEDGRYFTIKGSGTDRMQWIGSKSNTGLPGKYMYRIGNIHGNRNIEEPNENEASLDNIKAMSQSCSTGGSQTCHIKAQCMDRENGFCCVCLPGYYGNGKTCLKNDVPLRVNGKIMGEINGQVLRPIDLQAYVVMSDGRSYTALSHVPDSLGSSMQVLNVLGSVIGWLFAKPIENAKNGYQLTGGVLNHTAQISYRGTEVTIRQHYTGLDLFDQLRVEAEVRGIIEDFPPETIMEVSDYEEQYSISQPGLILCESQRLFKNKAYNANYPFAIKQSITYEVCPHAPPEDVIVGPFTLKVAKNFMGYEKRERIIRYGMSSKITPLGLEDPCIRGRQTCGELSSCVVEGDGYKCICNPGYHYIYPQGSDPICIDINECSSGTHNCDIHAQCFNQEGTFSCQCNEGYEGNGVSCDRIMVCAKHRCHQHAQCYESNGKPVCYCNEGYTGDGEFCWSLEGAGCDITQNCSHLASCDEIDGVFRCNCRAGYYGDGYTCTPEERYYTTMVPYYPDQDVDIIDVRCFLGECWCPEGYEKIEDRCHKIDDYYNTTPQPDNNEDESRGFPIIEQTPIPFCSDNGVCNCPATFDYDSLVKKCIPNPKYPHDTKGPSDSAKGFPIIEQTPIPFCSDNGVCNCPATFDYDSLARKCVPNPEYPHDTKGPSGSNGKRLI